MKILVTGSAGFIGGYLVDELLDRGHHVVGLDNLSKYGPVSRAHDNHIRYDFVHGDARDVNLVTSLLQGCDHFIAGAAMIGGISYFHALAYDLLATNDRITAAAADAALAARRRWLGKLQKVTWVSSSMVYESATTWPSREGDQLLMPPPSSSYGFQKLAVEYYARAAWAQHRLPYTIVRPFNCVGVGERRALGAPDVQSGNVKLAMSHVVPDLVHKVLAGQDPVHILGDGRQVRCYTYGGDLAAGIASTLDDVAAWNEDFNLSTAEQTTVADLADLIWRKVHGPGRPLRLHHDRPYEYDVQRRIPDITKARDLLGFTATTTLDTMLDEVIPWIRNTYRDGDL